MKVINAIKSDYSGKIMQVCFNDGDDIYDEEEDQGAHAEETARACKRRK